MAPGELERESVGDMAAKWLLRASSKPCPLEALLAPLLPHSL